MLGRMYVDENCSIARALELVGERWSLLIIRNAMFAGTTRFADFQRSLGVAPNILTARLDGFVAAGLMRRRGYAKSPERFEYLLTDKGYDLKPVILALAEFGDRWAAPDGPPIVFEHEDCGGAVHPQVVCECCGKVGDVKVRTRPGSGMVASAGKES